MDWMTVNDELSKMWKEAVMAYFKVLLPHLFGGNDGNPQNTWPPHRDLNQGFLKYKEYCSPLNSSVLLRTASRPTTGANQNNDK
jgi:hypothetical protein